MPATFDVEDNAVSRKAWRAQALRKTGSIGMMLPSSFMPDEKMFLGIHLELNKRGEHIIASIDGGSPAQRGGAKCVWCCADVFSGFQSRFVLRLVLTWCLDSRNLCWRRTPGYQWWHFEGHDRC